MAIALTGTSPVPSATSTPSSTRGTTADAKRAGATVRVGVSRAARTKRSSRLRYLRRALGPLLLIAIWQIGSWTGFISPKSLAPPLDVARAFWDLAASGELWGHLSVSLGRAFRGLVIGVTVGTLLAVVAGLWRVGEDLIDAPMQMLRTMPFLALIPLFILWFGIGDTAKVALIALGTAFPMYLNVYAGIRNVDVKLVEAARSLELGQVALIRSVILPGAMPSALVGLRYALGISVLALVVAEQINANQGIGYLMLNARDFLRTDIIVVGLVVYSLLGLGADLLVRLLEHHLLAWRKGFSGS